MKMKKKSKEDNYSDFALVVKEQSLNTNCFNLEKMRWEVPTSIVDNAVGESCPINVDKLIAYVRQIQFNPVSVEVSIPLDSINLKSKSVKVNREYDTLELDYTSPKTGNTDKNHFEELFSANKDDNFDIESETSRDNEKSTQLYDCDKFSMSIEETSKFTTNITLTPTSSSSTCGSEQSVSTVKLDHSDEELCQFDVETNAKSEKLRVEKYLQRIIFHEEISSHSENSETEEGNVFSSQESSPDKLTQINEFPSVTMISSTSILVDNNDELDYEPSEEKECPSTPEISSIVNADHSLLRDEIGAENLKDTRIVLNQLTEKSETSCSSTLENNSYEKSVITNELLSSSSDEIELEPDTNDIFYEECSNKSASTYQSDEKMVKSNCCKVSLTKTIKLKQKKDQNLLESVKGYLTSGTLKKALQQIEESTNYSSIGEALQLVIIAADKLPEIILETFAVYKKVFKNITPLEVHSDIVKKFFLCSKERSNNLGKMYKSLLELINNDPLVKISYDVCDVLLESLVYQADWPFVIRVLNYSLHLCRNKPHVKHMNSVLKVASNVPNSSPLIAKMFVKGQTLDRHFLNNFEQKDLENLYHLLKKYNKNSDAEKLGFIISDHWRPSSGNPPNNSFGNQGLIPPNSALQNLSTPELGSLQIFNGIGYPNWKELSVNLNHGIEFAKRELINNAFSALCNHQYPSQAYVQFLSMVQWGCPGTPMYSQQVTLLGQIGTLLFFNHCYEKQYEAAMQIIVTLHEYNINYYDLQKNISVESVPDFLRVMVISANKVALMAVNAAIQIENPFFAIQILNDCDWIRFSDNETSVTTQEELKQREEIFHSLIALIISKLSSVALQNSVPQTLELLSKGLKVLVMFSKINSAKPNIEDLYSKYYAYLLNMEMHTECAELDKVFKNPQPTLQRGFLLLLKKKQRDTKYLLQQLVLEGVYFKNNMRERTIIFSSHYTNNEFELLLANFFDRLYNIACKTSNMNYGIQIILEHCETNVDNHFGIKSLICSVDLNSSLDRLQCVLEKFELKTSVVNPGLTRSIIDVTQSSVYNYLNQNFKHLAKSLPPCQPFFGNQSNFFGGFESSNSSKIGIIKGIKKLDSPIIKTTIVRPPTALSRPPSTLKRRLGDKQSTSRKIVNKAIMVGQKKKFQPKDYENFTITHKFVPKRPQTPPLVPVTPPLDPPTRIYQSPRFVSNYSSGYPKTVFSSCEIPNAVQIKIENFLKSKLCSASKDPLQSKDLTKAFVHFIVKKFELSSIPALNASLLKELNKFALEKIKP